MQKTSESPEKPNLSSTAFFFGCALILILAAFIFTLGNSSNQKQITFGSCRLTAETAVTDQQKARGLSGRAEIDKNYAMIFPFKNEQPFFWMKDMLTSIDIVWVKNNKVVGIVPNLPVDDGVTQYQAAEPIDHVIEVAAGRSSACGLSAGSTISGL